MEQESFSIRHDSHEPLQNRQTYLKYMSREVSEKVHILVPHVTANVDLVAFVKCLTNQRESII